MSESELVAGSPMWNPPGGGGSWTWFDGDCLVRQDQVRSAWAWAWAWAGWQEVVVTGRLVREGGSLDPTYPCLLFVSAGSTDEGVGGAQQRPPTAHLLQQVHPPISLAFAQLPGAIGAKSLVLQYLTWMRTAPEAGLQAWQSTARHGRAWHE